MTAEQPDWDVTDRSYCDAPYPYAHLCSCDIPLDLHDDPKWHECGDCGREWHDDDFKVSQEAT